MFEITYGYDRHVRSWCIIVLDGEGNEVESHYLGSKGGCLRWVDELKESYRTDKVRKYKAY